MYYFTVKSEDSTISAAEVEYINHHFVVKSHYFELGNIDSIVPEEKHIYCGIHLKEGPAK